MERTIAFHEEFGNFDEKVLAELKFKLEVYQNLIFAIKQILALITMRYIMQKKELI